MEDPVQQYQGLKARRHFEASKIIYAHIHRSVVFADNFDDNGIFIPFIDPAGQ